MIQLPRVSFGTTSAVTTSMGLTVGLNAATASRAAIISGLLVIALADNISDSLSIHIYQESEKLEAKSALRSTLTNFTARFVLTLTFAVLVLLAPSAWLTLLSLIWGLGLLSALSYMLARERGVGVGAEILKHAAIAGAVIIASRLVGSWVHGRFG
jgi:hypothetical protein